ncbi:MAG TPA: SusF/SusE family outer membrane protein [Saprospiraceae bacterium]|nr:SusE domain-containing protein [Saprospiraceae bacterium]MCB9271741.1 SusE domain-containing protein [Lewinellaceae bacterium]HPG07890.1 SusF/SusE family outer membrane protein [Saprospiraceae bacterium]HPR01182.1 SusF/SusE family outer membrane protein [Saprospiraceae bacterium]HQU52131.1 SusF/SusE family outer membrane protein [Saprospiraceae bacterium]
MTKNIIYLTFLFFALFTACQDEAFGPVIQVGSPPAITSPAAGSNFVITEDKAQLAFGTFTWTPVEYGFQAAVSYNLEVDLANNSFSDPVSLGIINATSLDVINDKINSVLLAKGISGGTQTAMAARVTATVNPDVAPVVSEPLTFNVTPYEAEIIYPVLHVPGSYQGWNPGDEATVIFDQKNNGKFEGFINFPDGNTEFKFTDGPSWDVNYGDNGADGTLDRDGSNIVAVDAGVYRLKVDLNALTYSILKTDWGLIGSATPAGWDADQNMTYDPVTGIWSITLDLVAGEIKFRANDDWGINLGDNDANKKLEYDGSNIVIGEAGNYTIDLILNVPVYTYTVTKN